MQRSEARTEDTWDLTKFYKAKKEYDNDIKKIKELCKKIEGYQGHIMDSADSLYEFLELDTEMSLLHEKVFVYSYLSHYCDTADNSFKALKDKADRITEEVEIKTSFERSEMLSVSYDTVLGYIKENKKLEKYAFILEKMFRYKEHTLSTEEEKIISLASSVFGGCEEAYSALDNADAKFAKVKVNDEETELNHSNYITLMGNKDRKVREETFKKYYQFYIDHRNSITEMYKTQVKEDTFFTRVHKYSSSLERSLYSDAIETSVYHNLIDTIHDNVDLIYDYMKLRKDYFKFDEMHMYDIYVDMVEGSPRKFTYDEAREIVLSAVKPLGCEYVKDLTRLFDTRCIDKYPNEGKRSGAYQWGCYGIDPYVSINFEGTEDSVSTLAHELGHAMHSYYSDKNQEYIDAQYPIFLAEIASTVNEVLLNEYMIKNAKDDNERLLYITSFLDKFRATVFRQTQFAEFEMLVHELEEKEEAITPQVLEDIYYNLNKLYYGDNVVSDDEIRYEWSRIPHFYTPFYVYKYATGFVSALAIVSDILSGKENATENYLKFLSSGGSKYPLDTLKECGIDMNDSKTIIKALDMFKEKLKQAEEIIKKVK